jgi:peptide/nickel transport system permease protein
MAEITNPTTVIRLTPTSLAPNYMASVYSAIVGFLTVFGGLVGVYLLARGDIFAGLVALVITGLLAVLAWSMGQRKEWSYRFADGMHLAGLLGGVVLVVRWLIDVVQVIGTDPKIAAGGGSLGTILSNLRTLPINSLWLADAVIVIAISGGLAWLLRSIRKHEAELLIDRNHSYDLEQFMRRFLKSTSARVGGILVVGLLIVTYVMPRIDPYDRTVALSDGDLALRLTPPDCVIGWLRVQQGLDTWRGEGAAPSTPFGYPCKHPFGTDKNGRDLMRRVLHGINVSLVVSVISVSISLLIGATIGLVAGYIGGRWDSFLMRSMDIMLAFPTLLLAIAIVAMRGPGLENAMIAIGIVGIPTYARLARSMAISLREQEFVTAATSVGAKQSRILRQHVLPNSLAPLIVQSTLGLGTAVIETAALGFLGLGQQPPFPELGKMLAESREVMTSGMWWMILFPGITVMIIVLSFNLLGDALRDTLDPKLRGN